MADNTLQDRFDTLVADSDSPRRAVAATVIGRARRRRAGRVALAAAAVLAVLGVAIPAVVGGADQNGPVDAPEASPLSAAINPATAGWFGPWGLASIEDLERLPDPQMALIGCFNDGESAKATTAYSIASAPTEGRPEGTLASAFVDEHRTPAVAEELVPGLIRGALWCADLSEPTRLTAPGAVTGTYRALPLDAVYRFDERAQPKLAKGELPRGYVLHAWSVVNANRAGLLLISAPSDAGAPPVSAVFEAFAGFTASDAALENSVPY